MLICNGTPIVDKAAVQRAKVSSPLLATLRGLGGLKLAVDGSLGNVSPRDLVTGVGFTMAGGVGGAWTEESNWRTLLGCRAPVITGTTDNLLSDENASFEGGTVGNWAPASQDALAVSSLYAYHGAKCLAQTATGNGTVQSQLNITAVTAAGSQYTFSVKFIGVAGQSYTIRFYDNVTGNQTSGAFVATGSWQTISYTATFGAGSISRVVCLRPVGQTTGQITYWDATQLEAGAVATPFCLGSRTAGSMAIANPLTAGALTLIMLINSAGDGNDGLLRYLFDMGSVEVYKSAANNLTLEVTDGGAGTKTMSGAVNATNMAKNANHVVIAKHNGAGTLSLKLDNVALTTSAGAGTGIPAAPDATAYIGTEKDGTDPISGATMLAAYQRWTSDAEDAYLSKMTQWLPSLRTVY